MRSYPLPPPCGQTIYKNYLEFCAGDLLLIIYSIISINMDSWIFILYLGLQAVLLYCVTLTVLALTIKAPVPLWHTLIMVGVFKYVCMTNSLLSDIIRCSRLILCIFCYSYRISHFSKKLWFLLVKNHLRKQDVDANMLMAIGISLGFD